MHFASTVLRYVVVVEQCARGCALRQIQLCTAAPQNGGGGGEQEDRRRGARMQKTTDSESKVRGGGGMSRYLPYTRWSKAYLDTSKNDKFWLAEVI